MWNYTTLISVIFNICWTDHGNMAEKAMMYSGKTSSIVAFFTTDFTRTDIKRNLDLCCKGRRQNTSNRGTAQFCVFWEKEFSLNFLFFKLPFFMLLFTSTK